MPLSARFACARLTPIRAPPSFAVLTNKMAADEPKNEEAANGDGSGGEINWMTVYYWGVAD